MTADITKAPKETAPASDEPDMVDADTVDGEPDVIIESPTSFPIVGIGASAGGVQALQTFFEGVPDESGMAFVVILHLSPEYESNLPSLLQAKTAMTVTQVNEAVRVEPNHVYVIPPTKHLSMDDGHLRLAEAKRPYGRRVAIDLFFRTLAESHGMGAIAVVLSGTGTDGTVGLKRIKERGGIVIVQNPDEAEYSAMPTSAIATDLVDFVLPIAEMAEQLVQLKASQDRVRLPDEVASLLKNGAEALLQIFVLLRTKTGHDFSQYKRSTVLRRLERRLQVHHLADLASYIRLLRESPIEIQALLREILISVTNFFRDPEAFTTLEAKVIPNLFEEKGPNDMVRVWVAGTATGEEAYSFAMLLAEHATQYAHPPQFQVFATDIDEDALAFGREGLYPASIAADVSPERLQRFFTQENDHYRVRKEIRERVLFAPQNLLSDPPFSRLDLVTCRNVLIYLQRDVHKRLFQLFHFALLPGGYLFLGGPESADGVPDLFAPVERKLHIFQRRAVARVAPTFSGTPTLLRTLNAGDERTVEAPPLSSRTTLSFNELHRQLLEPFTPASIIVNEQYDIVHLTRQAGRYLQFVGGEPSHNLLRMVHPSLRVDLRAALYSASQQGESTENHHLPIYLDDQPHLVDLVVRPLREPEGARGLILVVFKEIEVETSAEIAARVADEPNPHIERLEEEFHRTRERLQTTVEEYEASIEELRAANEELQSINEEYQSTTEELETSKEELQSVNEELTTVNQELKNKVDEISHTNSDLQNLMDATDIGTLFVDRALRVRRFTPRATDLFNLIPTDVGRPLAHLTHRLRYEEMIEDTQQVLRQLAQVDRQIQDENGRWFLARQRPYRTLDDKIDGVVITFVDMTAQKEAELALHQSQQQMVETLERVTDAFYSLDRESRFIYVNPQAEKWWGVRRDKMLGLPIWEVFPQTRDILFYQEHLRAASERQPIHFDTHFSTLNRWVEVSIYPGESGLTVYLRDISERKQAEEALRESEERYRTLFNTIDEGFCTLEVLFDENATPRDYRFIDTNPAFERQTGLKQAVGKTMRELVPNHEAHWFEIYGEVALTGEAVRFENQANALNRWYDVYAFRIGEPHERRVAVLFNDISRRKQSEVERELLYVEMEQAYIRLEDQRARLAFLADASSTLLSASLNYSSTLHNVARLAVGLLADWAFFESLTNDGAGYRYAVACADPSQKALGDRLRAGLLSANRMQSPTAEVLQTGAPKILSPVPDGFLRAAAVNGPHLAALREIAPASWMTVPLDLDGAILGTLTFLSTKQERHYGPDELAVAQTFAQRAAFALENARLYRQSQQRLALSREEERMMLARELHDHVVQQLIGLGYQLRQHTKLPTDSLAATPERLSDLRGTLVETERQVLDLADTLRGVIADLRPPGLEEYGLTSALEGFVSQLESDHDGAMPEIELELDESGTELPLPAALALFRAAQEGVWNAFKHAAASRISIHLELSDSEGMLTVMDDGQGFAMPTRLAELTQNNHYGLVGISERVEILGGSFAVNSVPGDGTVLTVTVPLTNQEV